ncbi:MAG: HigA family addiction module antitoxin [Proteobacteria bacterium]|nr:HigA family addiction module antitoxin [Pseudomonadota bacterium]
MTNNTTKPTYGCSPGDILKDYMQAARMKQSDLASKMGVSAKTVSMLVRDSRPITVEYAVMLERIFGRPSKFWLNLEAVWKESIVREKEGKKFEKYKNWCALFKFNELVEFGLIRPAYNTADIVRSLMVYFKIGTPDAIHSELRDCQAHYRKSGTKAGTKQACLAWLTAGRAIVEQMSICDVAYSKESFELALNEIRKNMVDKPIDGHVLKQICSNAGVALVFVPPFKGLGIYGATHWISETPILQLSCNYDDDRFWFYFFHEACHILNDKKGSTSISFGSDTEEVEQRANKFAEDFLLPSVAMAYIRSNAPSRDLIFKIAKEQSVLPSIVVGRMKKEGIIEWTMFNDMHQKTNVRYDRVYSESD